MGKSTVKSRFNTAVNEAVREGRLDRKRQGPMIEAARKLAEFMDTEGWPVVDGKFDNVTPSTFLKYCEILRLSPQKVKENESAPKPRSVGNSKWRKATVDGKAGQDIRNRDAEDLHTTAERADA
jgi:hypothetical protein